MNWDYIAGFVDGEGTITFARQRDRHDVVRLMPMLTIYQKDPRPLRLIADVLPQQGLLRPAIHQSHRLDLRGRKILPVLTELEPRLIVKQRQAQILIDFIECRNAAKHQSQYDDHCKELDSEMRTINKRGASGAHNAWEVI